MSSGSVGGTLKLQSNKFIILKPTSRFHCFFPPSHNTKWRVTSFVTMTYNTPSKSYRDDRVLRLLKIPGRFIPKNWNSLLYGSFYHADTWSKLNHSRKTASLGESELHSIGSLFLSREGQFFRRLRIQERQVLPLEWSYASPPVAAKLEEQSKIDLLASGL